MPSTIIVNNMTTQHKMSTGVTTAFPDVCKTPAPPAPFAPIPYPNIANSMMASFKTSMRVTDNKQKVMVKGAAYTLSNGDQAGVQLGVVSNKIMGKSCIKNQSFTVKFENKGVGRLKDVHANNSGSPSNCVAPAQLQAPMMGTGANADKAACERLKDQQVPPDERGDYAELCGMLPEHAEGIRQGCAASGRSVSFRSTNAASSKHIASGLPAKGCDIPEKSISEKTIGMASPAHQDKINSLGLDGLVGAYEGDGKGKRLVGVRTTDGHIPFDDISSTPPPPNNAYTGDYDAHDMFDSDGSRIRDGSKQEKSMRRQLNRDCGRGMGSRQQMVRHGPQNNYSDYAKRKGKKPIPSLQLPDVSKKEPLLVFDGNGEMYLIEDESQLRDYYACKGQPVPPEWDEPQRSKIEKKAGVKPPDRFTKRAGGG